MAQSDADRGQAVNKPATSETQPLLRRPSITSRASSENATRQLTARHAFAVLVTSQIGSGIFASRFSSACTPNVSKSWDDIPNAMILLRDVAEGEELRFSYCGVLRTQEEWKRRLLEDFGFECTGAACQLEGEEALESDKLRPAVT